MKHKSWRSSSLTFQDLNPASKSSRLSPAHSSMKRNSNLQYRKKRPLKTPSPDACERRDYSILPDDVLIRITASFSHHNLKAVSLVCKSWNEALRPLREAMLFVSRGKRFKHGRGGVEQNSGEALDSFLRGAALGSTLAMVHAGLAYWDMGRRDKGIALYQRAAELGDRSAQCNLGIAYLEEPGYVERAIDWLFQAASAGHARAQYQLALCIHQGYGVDHNISEAAKWYLRAAEGGYARAMYNVSLCYSAGRGLQCDQGEARNWMKKAANLGHSKAQYEHGFNLFSVGNMLPALVYLELASRAGETAASRFKDVVLQKLSAPAQKHAMLIADTWRPLR